MPDRSGFQPLDCLAAIPAWGVAPGWDGGSPLALGVVGIFGRLEALPRRLVSFVHLECVAESLALREASRLIPSKAAFVLWPLRRGESGLKPRPTSRALSRPFEMRLAQQCGRFPRSVGITVVRTSLCECRTSGSRPVVLDREFAAFSIRG